jgi:hypothetical protein
MRVSAVNCLKVALHPGAAQGKYSSGQIDAELVGRVFWGLPSARFSTAGHAEARPGCCERQPDALRLTLKK